MKTREQRIQYNQEQQEALLRLFYNAYKSHDAILMKQADAGLVLLYEQMGKWNEEMQWDGEGDES